MLASSSLLSAALTCISSEGECSIDERSCIYTYHIYVVNANEPRLRTSNFCSWYQLKWSLHGDACSLLQGQLRRMRLYCNDVNLGQEQDGRQTPAREWMADTLALIITALSFYEMMEPSPVISKLPSCVYLFVSSKVARHEAWVQWHMDCHRTTASERGSKYFELRRQPLTYSLLPYCIWWGAS